MTVISKAEKTEACGKLLIEDFLEVIKEQPKTLFKSEVFKAGNSSFRIVLMKDPIPRNRNSDIVWAYVANPTNTDLSVASISIEAKIMSSRSTEMINLKKANLGKGFTLNAKNKMGLKFFRHAECEAVCKEGDDLLVELKMQLQGTE